MELMTKELEKKFEQYPLYSQDGKLGHANVVTKFFNPYGTGTWLITEGEKTKDGDFLMFGYGHLGDDLNAELGYVSLSELKGIGFIERDVHLPDNCDLVTAMKLSGINPPEYMLKDYEETIKPKIIYFDTETTGLSPTDEILSISIVDNDKNVLLDTLVKPERHETWDEAQKINGITPEAVRSAPTIGQLSQKINAAFRDCDMFVAYNAPYDMQYIKPVLLSETLKGLDEKQKDCMADFAQHYGEPDTVHGGFKHKKLVEAAAYFDVKWDGAAHGSLADTLATREVWLKLHPEYAPEVKSNASLSNKAVQQAPKRKL